MLENELIRPHHSLESFPQSESDFIIAFIRRRLFYIIIRREENLCSRDFISRRPSSLDREREGNGKSHGAALIPGCTIWRGSREFWLQIISRLCESPYLRGACPHFNVS